MSFLKWLTEIESPQESIRENDSFIKGDRFESHVATYFPESYYKIVQATTTRNDLEGRRIEQSLQPDFKFRHEMSGHCFWIECKFRGALLDDKIQWSDIAQLERYKRFQESVRPERVFVVIGYGGTPSCPNSLYCIPLSNISYPGLYPNAIEKYKHRPDRMFWYSSESVY